MKPFSLLAQVYDEVMDDVNYESWIDFILDTLHTLDWRGETVLDLGCGTGNSTIPFFARGLQVTGLDASEEMLAVARSKLPFIPYVQADFATFSLPERFDLIVSVFDSLNNLLEPQAFVATLERVHTHLTPNGIFMFDVNTTVGLRDLWESGRAEGWINDVYYLWEHSFDEDTGIAKVVAYCEKDGRPFTEIHFERPYDPPEMRAYLEAAGFSDIRFLSYPSGRDAAEDAARVWVVARKPL